jgi:hypothetical protein
MAEDPTSEQSEPAEQAGPPERPSAETPREERPSPAPLSAERPPSRNPEAAAVPKGPKSWFRLTWVKATTAAAATAIVGGTASAVIVPIIADHANSIIDSVTTSGQPVAIHVDLEPATDDVSLPSDQTLSDADLAALSTMPWKQADEWLATHKHGIITSTRTVSLTLRGNRPNDVRITGVDVSSSCHAPDRGTMVRMAYGRGDGVVSERMEIDASSPDPEPYTYSTSAAKQPYFPYKTIVLAQNEEQVVAVDVNPTFDGVTDPAKDQVCDVKLTLDLLQGDKESTEKVPTTVEVMGIESMAADADYKKVYLGTGICKTFVVAAAGWSADPTTACGGQGNVQNLP